MKQQEIMKCIALLIKVRSASSLMILMVFIAFSSCKKPFFSIEVDTSLQSSQVAHATDLLLSLESLSAAAFKISNQKGVISIRGSDETGLMYVLLDTRD